MLFNFNLLTNFNFNVRRNANKVIRKIPVIQGLGKDLLVESELWMSKVLFDLKDNLNEKVFVDVGVNIGQTLIKVKELFPQVEYIGFEPNPHCVAYVLNLITINKLENTKILPIALSNERNHCKLLLDNSSLTDSSGSIIKSYRKGQHNRLDVITLTPNDISVLSETKIGIIKIDVEGAEYEVLQGMRKLILKNKPKIIIEILPVYKSENIERYNRQTAIEKFIKEINYFIYRISEKNGNFEMIQTFGIHGDLSKCNYILSANKLD